MLLTDIPFKGSVKMSEPSSAINPEKKPSSEQSAQQPLVFDGGGGGGLLTERAAWLVLLVTLTVTFFVWNNAQTTLLNAQQAQLKNHAEEVSTAIIKRMQGYEQALRGGAGLFAASKSVERDEWREYIASLKIQKHLPGIQGIGYSVHIPATRLNAHLRAIRAEGYPDYALRPAGVRAEYSAIIYLEPLDRRNQRAIGFDMLSEANRRTAMERARDTGDTTISAKVTLVQEDGKAVQPGMLMYQPLYKNRAPHNTLEERRANLVGYVYSPFRMSDLMNGILEKKQVGAESDIDIEVYDGTLYSAASLLYDNDGIAHALGTPPAGSLTLNKTIDLYGHTWSINFTSSPAFHAAFDQNKPLRFLVTGTLLSMMLSGLIWMFAIQRRRALLHASHLAKEHAKLHASELHERAVLDNMDEGIVSISETGIIELFNPAAVRLFGYPSFEVIGKNVSMLMPEPYHSEHDGYLANYHRTGQAKIIGSGREVTGLRSDGSIFPIALVVSEFSLEGRRQFIGCIRDISKRKLADAEILRFKNIMDNTLDMIFMFEPESLCFVYLNQGAILSMGYSEEELLVMKPYQIKPLISEPEFRQLIAPLIEGEQSSLRFETLHRRKDGSDFSVNILLQLVVQSDGSSLFVAIVRDITERKKVERELQKRYEKVQTLLTKVQEIQAQLLQSEKMSAIGQLAAGVAHEINNPIGYVYSNLNGLEKYLQDIFNMLDSYEQAESAIADSAVRTCVQAAREKLDLPFLKKDIRALMSDSKEGVNIVRGIVKNLKDFSHIDAGDDNWHYADLHVGLNNTLNIVNNEIKYKAEVIKQYGEIPEVECLASQLNQVFMNLLINAAQAIEKRGSITLRSGTKGDEVWLEVSDTGNGIAPENLQKIFDPFFTTKPVGKGTGLGLSLSYSIIQKHHGRIEVSSEVGKGTTFVVWLPVKHV